MVDKGTVINTNKTSHFHDGIWKQFRLSKRKAKANSFVTYCSDLDEAESTASYISYPTNFEIKDIHCQNTALSLQKCPFDVTGYGNLILRDKFKLKRPKKKKVTGFLFEKIIVFMEGSKNEDVYYYFGSINISNLSVAPPTHNKTQILLKDFVNSKLSKTDIEYKLEAKTEAIHKSWRDALQMCLWQQLISAKDQLENG